MIYLGGFPMAINGVVRGFSTMVRVEETDETEAAPGYYFGPAEFSDGWVVVRFDAEFFQACENIGEVEDNALHFAVGAMLPDDYERASARNQRRLAEKQRRKLKVDTKTPAVLMRDDGKLQELSRP